MSIEFDETVACHDPSQWGFFAIAKKGSGARAWEQHSHRLPNMPDVLRVVGNDEDTYISQASFSSPNRQIANLRRIGLCWVDLDTYNVPALANVPVEHIAQQLLYACDDLGIPHPSVIIDSGNGMYAKWYFDGLLPAYALPRWQLVQNVLCDRLAGFGADKNARDASRVLRIVGTRNTKTGRTVSVIWKNAFPTHGGTLVDGVTAYPFGELADTLLPHTREEIAALREKHKQENAARKARQTPTGQQLTLIERNTKGLRPFLPSQLAWDRYNDIVKLGQLRGWDAGAPARERDIPVFLCAALMAQALVVSNFHFEVEAIAKKFAPTWSTAELNSCIFSVVARAEAAARGEKIEYKGKLRDPRYFFKNETLIALLNITQDEQAQMTAIVSVAEGRRRDAARQRAKREAAGAATREQYLADAASAQQRAHALHAEGKSWGDVGAMMGLSANAARKAASRANGRRPSASVYM